MKLYDDDRFEKAINLLMHNFPRHAAGIRKIRFSPEKLCVILDLIEFQELQSQEVSQLLNELINFPEIDLVAFLASKGTDLSNFRRIQSSDDAFWDESKTDEFGDFKDAALAFKRQKLFLAKTMISYLEWPTAALNYESCQRALGGFIASLDRVCNYWARKKMLHGKQHAREVVITSSQTDALLKSHYELEDFHSSHPPAPDDFEEINEKINEEIGLLREELTDYNESASRSHRAGWFYDD